MSQLPTTPPAVNLPEGSPGPAAGKPRRAVVGHLIRKALSLIAVGLVLGWVYAWAAPRLYRAEHTAGFWLGTAHGALMPVALPSLLMGKDVPIYTPTNSGRGYKLGYIAGINLCGLVFFGLAFRPAGRDKPRVQ